MIVAEMWKEVRNSFPNLNLQLRWHKGELRKPPIKYSS